MPVFDMFLDGAIASATATIVSNPFDLMRSRLSVQGELQKKGEYKVVYTSLPQGIAKVAREEGLLALEKGLFSAMLWQFLQNGVRIGLYAEVKGALEAALLEPPNNNSNNNSGSSGSSAATASSSSSSSSFPPNTVASATPTDGGGGVGRLRPASTTSSRALVGMVSGCITAVLGTLVSSPFNLVKTRLHVQAAAAAVASTAATTGGGPSPSAAAAAVVGRQYQYRGVWDALRTIYREKGVRGLWHGSPVAGQREMAVSVVQFTTYDAVKRLCHERWGMAPDDRRVPVISAAFGSLGIVLCTNPLMVVQTRVYNNAERGKAVYSSNLVLTTWRIAKVEGVHGLYKGSTAFFCRSAPHAIVTFSVLEYIREKRNKYHFSYTAAIQHTLRGGGA